MLVKPAMKFIRTSCIHRNTQAHIHTHTFANTQTTSVTWLSSSTCSEQTMRRLSLLVCICWRRGRAREREKGHELLWQQPRVIERCCREGRQVEHAMPPTTLDTVDSANVATKKLISRSVAHNFMQLFLDWIAKLKTDNWKMWSGQTQISPLYPSLHLS